MAGAFTLPNDYWLKIQIAPQEIEHLQNYLFERETPLSTRELALALVEFRVATERATAEGQRDGNTQTYFPKDKYSAGASLAFSALNWKRGKVTAVRAGVNPAVQEFEVLTVALEDGSERLFASGLADHALNAGPLAPPEADDLNPELVVQEHGDTLAHKLEQAFSQEDGLVRIAGRWFPRALLIDIKQGQLNLAEAVLDMAGGEPLTAETLIKDLDLPAGDNPKLAEFSLNYALQSDERFDEVGPVGQVLWCLRRLEPDYVREVPPPLRYEQIAHERSALTDAMETLEAQLDDELTETEDDVNAEISAHTITLIYPHLRAGTLPMSHRARKLFPTAQETARVRFTLVDGKTKQRIPAWVVLEHGYVFGLREWYKSHQLIPGSLVQIRRGEQAGEVIVEAKTQRSSKDWVRTVMVGTDGGFVFAMLKQAITAEFNERMAIQVPDFKALDPLWEKKRAFEDLVVLVMRELSKSNPQGHVHAQELYAGVNLLRRVPPAPIFALLATNPIFKHVGDLHFRLDEEHS